MSSPAQNAQNVVAKASRQPSLPDKYGKFIQFAYYMMENVFGEDFQMDKAAYLEKIKLFGTVEEQQVLVQGFLDNVKETKKTIKTVLSDKKKELAKAAKIAAAASVPKRTRKTTTKVALPNAEYKLINELVEIAQTSEKKVDKLINELVEIAQTSEKKVEPVVVAPAEVVEKKPKKKAAAKTAPVEEPKEEVPITITNELVPETFVTETEPQTKPKRKPAAKKTKQSTHATTDAAILDDLSVIPNTDIEISPITVGDTTYFMDEFSNIYSYPTPTAKSIGKYNPYTKEVVRN
jgi:hypothetical protein